jgi:hypothetical protein
MRTYHMPAHTHIQDLETCRLQLESMHSQHAAFQKEASDCEAGLKAKVAALEDEVRVR